MIVVESMDDIFVLPKTGEACVVTTNGCTDKFGNAVMGAGQALQCKKLFNCHVKLGKYLRTYGNRAFNLGLYQRDKEIFTLFSFPTKNHWKDKSDIGLIVKSANELSQMCDKFGVTKCYLPLVGCGLGGLSWEHSVFPVLSGILDDRFVVLKRSK